MSDVVIRCPNCGTTQATLGECDACHEATTRHFCPNHTPGRWLDGPVCPACGAHAGGGRGSGAPLPPGPGRHDPRMPPVMPGPGTARRPAPPRVRRIPTPPPVHEAEEPILSPGESGWGGLGGPLGWPGGARGRRDRPDGAPPPFPLPVVTAGFGSIFGCLGRAVLSIVALLALAALAFFGSCGVY